MVTSGLIAAFIVRIVDAGITEEEVTETCEALEDRPAHERLAYWLQYCGWPQTQIAEMLGVSQPTVSRLLKSVRHECRNGYRQPQPQ